MASTDESLVIAYKRKVTVVNNVLEVDFALKQIKQQARSKFFIKLWVDEEKKFVTVKYERMQVLVLMNEHDYKETTKWKYHETRNAHNFTSMGSFGTLSLY